MNIIFLGKPGAGKGSVCSEFEKRENVIHVSTGQIFRKEIAAGTPLGKLADSYISKGNLCPDEVTNDIMENLLKKNPKASYLFDGYPRTIPQAKALREMMARLSMKLDAVIDLDVRDEVIIGRLSSRRVCSKCGETYNTVFRRPKVDGICDVCGAPVIIRADDNKDAIKERLEVYKNQTQPLIDYYKSYDELKVVNGETEPSKTYESIKLLFEGSKSGSSNNL